MKKLSIITLFLVMSSSMYSQLLGPLINSDRFVVFARTGTTKRESLASDIRKYVLKANNGLRVVYSPNKPLSCGARVWIETNNTIKID